MKHEKYPDKGLWKEPWCQNYSVIESKYFHETDQIEKADIHYFSHSLSIKFQFYSRISIFTLHSLASYLHLPPRSSQSCWTLHPSSNHPLLIILLYVAISPHTFWLHIGARN